MSGSDLGSRDGARASRKPWLWTGAALVVFVLLYVLVLFLYANSTRLDTSGASPAASSDPDAIEVILEVTSVNALESSVSGSVQVLPGENVQDKDAILTRTIEVNLVAFNPTATEDTDLARSLYRPASVKFEAGRSALGLSAPVTIRTNGNYQDYPFDTFRSQIVSLVQVGEEASLRGQIPVNLNIVGDAPGWLIQDRAITGQDGEDVFSGAATADDEVGRFATELFLTRAGSTKSFVLLLLFAMVVLGVTALLVARAVSTRKRRIEATMASWFAAMLFAVIPLRLNMPGSPPIGVWIDFIVLMWVELALMIGLAIFIASWLRYTARPESATPEPESEPESEPEPEPEPERSDA